MRDLDFDAARDVAETIARHALRAHPREVTVEWAVERRRGKIFFDYNQNSRGKSLAVPYSPRRHAAGTVSTPVRWEELESVYPTDFTLRTVPDRLERGGDPWAGILDRKQDLGAVLAAAGTAPHDPLARRPRPRAAAGGSAIGRSRPGSRRCSRP